MTQTTEQFWSGEFGDEYTKRNFVRWMDRISFWRNIIKTTQARSYYEIGCNAGWNLSAIKAAAESLSVESVIGVGGCEINHEALYRAIEAGFKINRIGDETRKYEFVFTSGVLIHQNADECLAMMRRVIDLSYKYVLCVEYESEQLEEIEYRGHAERLWKRPYTAMYQDLGLNLLSKGKLSKEDGFDNCAYGLFEKS